ncbi:granzyme A-like [Carcharodon carcharias]|uniref:granzyme A-like n=1 Tax=Carcharodon carcharias TaxID=13397 RepID=UPI001B7DBA16|nr:granzyme A-like [Carcharodon carcharias]
MTSYVTVTKYLHMWHKVCRPCIAPTVVGVAQSATGLFQDKAAKIEGHRNTERFLYRHVAEIVNLESVIEGPLDIIGGHDVESHSRLYMPCIQVNEKHSCGGALIEPQWVLTAARCNTKVEELEVVLGAHSLSKQKTKQKIKVMKMFPHPNFKIINWLNFYLSLLQLKNKAILNKLVSTLKLPKSTKSVKPGTKCSVAGWGETNAANLHSDTLKEANLTVMEVKICKKIYSLNLTKNLVCAGDKNQRQDVCLGDSGDPLLCKKKWPSQTVYSGIASFGSPCKDYTKPGVYTHLSNKYLSRIKNIMQNE